jgi:hypothetical protein
MNARMHAALLDRTALSNALLAALLGRFSRSDDAPGSSTSTSTTSTSGSSSGGGGGGGIASSGFVDVHFERTLVSLDLDARVAKFSRPAPPAPAPPWWSTISAASAASKESQEEVVAG